MRTVDGLIASKDAGQTCKALLLVRDTQTHPQAPVETTTSHKCVVMWHLNAHLLADEKHDSPLFPPFCWQRGVEKGGAAESQT